MSLIKKLIIKLFLSFFICSSLVNAEEIKKVGKYKDWEAVVYLNGVEKVCFAQSKPVLQSPKKVEREARLFVSFRPNEKIVDEVSTTSATIITIKIQFQQNQERQTINLISNRKVLLGLLIIKSREKLLKP